MSTYFRTGIYEKKGPKMIRNNFGSSFYLNMVKDLELAMSAAQSFGISLPLTALAQQIYRATNNSGFSEQDYTSIFALIERINGKIR
jgi:3-hydroxyisobutyrate dehydrogenase-like beta-hydroxyacid dehydrogenase